ncbi:MAG TPA: hypothetical protein VIH56_03195 [Candidatus Acidoferrales bacterium]
MLTFLNIMLLILNAAFIGIGIYLSSYLKTKGEHLATKEDFDQLRAQTAVLTQTTREIEAKISNEAWNRQRHWEMKRDAIFAAIQAVLKADDALESVARGLRLESVADDPELMASTVSERCRKCISIIDAVKSKRVLALIVCGRDLDGALCDVYEGLRLAATELGDCNVKGYEELAPVLRKNFARAMSFARRELGIGWFTPQSTESSAAPTPAKPNPEAK